MLFEPRGVASSSINKMFPWYVIKTEKRFSIIWCCNISKLIVRIIFWITASGITEHIRKLLNLNVSLIVVV